MTATALTPGAPLHLAPGVVRSPLPYGGVVFINGVTLALVEFSERDSAAIDGLLLYGVPPLTAGPAPQRLTHQLVEAGWLAPVPTPDRDA